MLIRFSCRNFKTFKDEAVISFSASKITEYSSHVMTDCKESVLHVSVIYGAYGTGKTAFLEAFRYMTRYVINSLGYEEGVDERKTGLVRPVINPYLSDRSSYFEEFFTADKKIYQYGFTIDDRNVQEE